MSCTQNPKRTWIFGIRYLGSHKEEITRIGRFMPGTASNYFYVGYRCKVCGCERVDHFVTWNDLLKQGVPNEVIAKASTVEF